MIIFSAASLYPYGINRIFDITSQSGFENIELMLRSRTDNAYYDTWDVKYLKALKKQHNLNIQTVHVSFDFEINPLPFYDIVSLTEGIGAARINVHTPRNSQDEYIKWFNSTLADFKHPNIEIVVENVHKKIGLSDPLVIGTAEEMNKFPHTCYDIAHAMRSGVDVLDTIPALRNVKQYHLSNWDGTDDHMSPLDNTGLFKQIIPLMITSDISIELCPKAFSDITNQKNIIEHLTKLRQFIELYL